MERVYALYARDEAMAKLAELSQNLPVSAQRELSELYQQYVPYAQAVAQNDPPGLNGESLDRMRRQTDPNLSLEDKAARAQEALKKSQP